MKIVQINSKYDYSSGIQKYIVSNFEFRIERITVLHIQFLTPLYKYKLLYMLKIIQTIISVLHHNLHHITSSLCIISGGH